MLRFAANISFLFKELPFLDRFAAAAEAGFKLVECHWPYDNSIEVLRERLERSQLSLVMVNTAPGNLDAGDFGLGAMPGREADFQAALDQSLLYVSALGATVGLGVQALARKRLPVGRPRPVLLRRTAPRGQPTRPRRKPPCPRCPRRPPR